MRSIRTTAAGIAMAAWTAATAMAGPESPVFQYSAPVATGKGQSAAFLWIPPTAQQVRGVILAGMTLMEQPFAKDAVIRQACADQQLAIVFLKCGLGGTDLQKMLDDFARVSGYRELSVAPLMFVGHSAGGPQAQKRAQEMPKRCFGLLQYRGGMPSTNAPIETGIPSLAMVGQFDEFGGTMRREDGNETWQRAQGAVIGFRAANEKNLASVVVEPGAGHFPWSDRKAAQARIPDSWPIDATQPVPLKTIDHTTGWLTDLTVTGKVEMAAFADYKGDKARTSWHFDNEMAEATVAYHNGISGKKDQFVKWNDPCWVDAGSRYFFTSLKWIGDGRTLEVHPVYADQYPGQHNGQGPKWLEAGQPVGHSSAPILVKPASGPIVATGPNTFRIRYDALSPAGEGARATFMAYSVGDAEYRYTERVGMMPRGYSGLTAGKDQVIAFPAIGNLKANSAPLELKATSDAGLPVEYYVAYGPATIADGKLVVREVPARATYPIEVKVVACQFGSGIAPQVKTAKPAQQTLQIEK
jgi:hypothetical protein